MDYQDIRSADIAADFYSDPRERKFFLCKLFSTLFIQFCVVTIGSFACRNKNTVGNIAYHFSEYRVLFGFLGLFLLLLMLYIEKMRRFSPLNVIFIIIITLDYTATYVILIESMDLFLIYLSYGATFLIFLLAPLIAHYLPINLTASVFFSMSLSAAIFVAKLLLALILVFIHSPLMFLMFLLLSLVETVYVLIFLFHYVKVGPNQIGGGIHHPLYFMKGDDKSCETRIGIACFAILSLFQVMFNLLLCTFFVALIIRFQFE